MTFNDFVATAADILPYILTGTISGFILLTAFFLSAFGVVILYAEIFPARKERAVKATIKAVRQSAAADDGAEIYYPVFEYTDTDGTRKEAESLSGSSSLADKIPGTQVRIRLSNSKDGWATQLGMSGFVMGFGLMAVGGVIGYAAVVLVATLNPTTYVIWSLIGLFALNKFRTAAIIPKNLRETKEAWQTRNLKESNANRESMRLLDRTEVNQKLAQE